MQLPLIYLAFCSLAQSGFVRNVMMSRHSQSRPVSFRPGVVMRPWTAQLAPPAAAPRRPYVMYRNGPHSHRISMKHYLPTRLQGVWTATKRPPMAAAEFDFVRAASAAPHGVNGGAIHTIPAPNLSLSEKPIVVLEQDAEHVNLVTSELPPKYEVTESTRDPPTYQMAKIEQPIGFSKVVNQPIGFSKGLEQPVGFSKATTLSEAELSGLIQTGALQVASDLGLPSQATQTFGQYPAITHLYPQPPLASSQSQMLPVQSQTRHHSSQHHPYLDNLPLQQLTQIVGPAPTLPHAFRVQGFNIMNPQQLIQSNPEGIVISPSALYQPDPTFMQKLTNHILQRFPGVEFIPYIPEVHQQLQTSPTMLHSQTVPAPTPDFLTNTQTIQFYDDDSIMKQSPSPFSTRNVDEKNIYQRETEENTLVTLGSTTPEIKTNDSEKDIEVKYTTGLPQTSTSDTPETIAEASEPSTTTVKYIIETTENQKTTPFYLQALENNIVNGLFSTTKEEKTTQDDISPFYSTQTQQPVNNDQHTRNVISTQTKKESATDFLTKQTEKTKETIVPSASTTSATNATTVKQFYFKNPDFASKNLTILGIPFTKPGDSVDVAYTLVRADDKQPKVTKKDGSVYAGQLVEAVVSEDQDFNKAKAAHKALSRAPIRLITVTEKTYQSSTTNAPTKVTVVKAKIPPKSKLTFDAKTGEPVLRIYASYATDSVQKSSPPTPLNQLKEGSTKPNNVENWKSSQAKALHKTEAHNTDKVTQFGVKLTARSDQYTPLFDDYVYRE